MNCAIVGATVAGAFVFVTSICWTQSWAQDQGRPPAPPALVGMGLPEVPPEQVGMSKQKLDRIHDALKQHVADGKLPAPSCWSPARASSSMPTPPVSRTRTKASRWRSIPCSASIR